MTPTEIISMKLSIEEWKPAPINLRPTLWHCLAIAAATVLIAWARALI